MKNFASAIISQSLFMQVRCAARALQLVLNTPVKNSRKLNGVIESLAKIVPRVKKSIQNSEIIEEEFGKTFLRRCDTRWNSNFKVAERASSSTGHFSAQARSPTERTYKPYFRNL